MDRLAQLPASERAIVFRGTAARLRVGSATIVERISGFAGRFKESSRVDLSRPDSGH